MAGLVVLESDFNLDRSLPLSAPYVTDCDGKTQVGFILTKCPDITDIVEDSPYDMTLDVHDLLILWLLLEREKGKKSKYFHFLKFLPKNNSCPLAFPSDGM